MIYSKKQVSRFWSNVQIGEPDECWMWKRSRVGAYGQVAMTVGDQQRSLKAHKVAWEINNNTRIGFNVRTWHSCDNGLCCNPNHVVVSTESKEPHANHSRGNSKLSTSQVQLIKYKLNELTTREVATAMGVSYHAIWDIRTGITWRHV